MSARYITPLTPGRRNYGHAVSKIAAALGTPPMPWQRHAYALTTEQLENGSWAYRTVVVTVPRQAGKTTMRGPLAIHRAIIRPMGRMWITAQTRQDARDIVVDEVGRRLAGSPLATLATLRRSQGSEGLTFSNGATWRVFAPAEDALHGKANESVDVDEGWSFNAVQGAQLEQAILPTFSTTGGQFSMVSTAGDAKSHWLRGYVDRGRASVLADRRQGIAYIEWSLPDDVAEDVRQGLDADNDSPAWTAAVESVIAHHPAHGYTLRSDAVYDAARTMSPDGFLRGYGNIWTVTTDAVIPPASWARQRAKEWPRPTGPVALAFEVGLDRVDSTIAAAWRDAAGALHLDIIEHGPGADWLPGRVLELAAAWHPLVIACDHAGPVVDVADQLGRAGLAVRALATAEYTVACAGILADISDGLLFHPGHPALDAAVAAAAKRKVGESWAWGRLTSAASIAPLVAVTVARYALDHAPVAAPKPTFSF